MILAIGILTVMLASCGSKSDDPNSSLPENDSTTQEDFESQDSNNTQGQTPDENKTDGENNAPSTTPDKPADNSGGTTTPPASGSTTTRPSDNSGNHTNNNTSSNAGTATEKPDKLPERPTTKPPTTPKPDVPDKTPVSKPETPQKKYSISEVHNLVKKAYGSDYYADTAIPKDALSSLFGINLSDVEEFIAEQPMISANIDTFVAIKAVSGKGEAVANALNAYKKSLTSQGACLYPSNIPKAQAGQVVRHGDYVFLVMLGAAGDDTKDEATQLQFAKNQVAKGVNVIHKYFA